MHLPSPLGGHCKLPIATAVGYVRLVASTKPVGRALQERQSQGAYQAIRRVASTKPVGRALQDACQHNPGCRRYGCIYQARWEGTARPASQSCGTTTLTVASTKPVGRALQEITFTAANAAGFVLHLPSPLGGHCKGQLGYHRRHQRGVASTKPVGRALQGVITSTAPSLFGVASTKPVGRALQVTASRRPGRAGRCCIYQARWEGTAS